MMHTELRSLAAWLAVEGYTFTYRPHAGKGVIFVPAAYEDAKLVDKIADLGLIVSRRDETLGVGPMRKNNLRIEPKP